MSLSPEHKAVYKVALSSDFMRFTRYFFKKQYRNSFIVNHHHREIVDALMRVYRGEVKRLIINIAPRYGKTELAVKNFIAWCLANNPSASFIHLSYSDSLALDNSEAIRDLVTSSEYQELFPEVQIKKDSNAKNKWYTTEKGGVYATATGGQITGFGAGAVQPSGKFDGAIIIDDPIKPDDAESSTIRDRINFRYDGTIKNRINSEDTPIIVIMQRLHPEDLSGYLIEHSKENWEVVKLPVIREDEGKEVALWPFRHSLERLKVLRASNPTVFERQYMQNPIPREGLLYTEFRTYSKLPSEGRLVTKAYVDTADTGKDYLCSIVYLAHEGLIYLIDVIYTQEPMEITERKVSGQFERYGVNVADIESNNGGRGFARNVERLLTDAGVPCSIKWFHQSQNKEARIFSQSANVQNYVRYPENWVTEWSEFSDAIRRYTSKGKNAHDDAPDALTGCVEKGMLRKRRFIFE